MAFLCPCRSIRSPPPAYYAPSYAGLSDGKDPGGEKDAEALEQEKQSIQEPLILLKVDREIKRLNGKLASAQQGLHSAEGDESKTCQVKQHIAKLESEPAAKDNDAYRRQHATVVQG